MIIPIDEKYRISSNEYSWDLEEVTPNIDKRTGKPKVKKLGYYTSLGKALSAAAQRELRLSDAVGLVEAEKAVAGLTRKYAALFDEVGKP